MGVADMAVEVPHVGDDLSVWLFVPTSQQGPCLKKKLSKGLDKFEEHLEGEAMAALMGSAKKTEMKFQLPKHEYNCSQDVAGVLKSLSFSLIQRNQSTESVVATMNRPCYADAPVFTLVCSGKW